MKLRLRFIIFFIVGLILFIMFTGLFVLICAEYVIPRLAENAGLQNALNIAAIIIPFLLFGALLGLFFVNPLVFMLMLIKDLSLGNEPLPEMNQKLYGYGNKLKARYFLYRELISDIGMLSRQLRAVEQERSRLEEAKTNWIAGVSHDLKTPLSYITGYSSLLLEHGKTWTSAETEKFLHEIHDKSVVISDLIGDLNLSFKMDAMSTTYPLTKKHFDLVDFSKNLLADIASGPKAARHEFSFNSNVDSISIYADEKLIYRAFQNIVMNAVTHNPQNTSIELGVFHDTDSGQLSVMVTDSGVGMSEGTVKNLFHRYYRPNESENVSGGLGLSVAKSIIEAHDGRIGVKSEIGVGTSIEIVLPR